MNSSAFNNAFCTVGRFSSLLSNKNLYVDDKKACLLKGAIGLTFLILLLVLCISFGSSTGGIKVKFN